MELRTDNEPLFLIGEETEKIGGHKLPTQKPVLSRFFYILHHDIRQVKTVASKVIDEVMVFWEWAGITTRYKWHCTTKLERLYTEYTQLKKHRGRKNNLDAEKTFSVELDKLFDIASEGALQSLDETKEKFLRDQRTERIYHLAPVGGMILIDLKLIK